MLKCQLPPQPESESEPLELSLLDELSLPLEDEDPEEDDPEEEEEEEEDEEEESDDEPSSAPAAAIYKKHRQRVIAAGGGDGKWTNVWEQQRASGGTEKRGVRTYQGYETEVVRRVTPNLRTLSPALSRLSMSWNYPRA